MNVPYVYISCVTKYFQDILGVSSSDITDSMLVRFVELGEPERPSTSERQFILNCSCDDGEEDFEAYLNYNSHLVNMNKYGLPYRE